MRRIRIKGVNDMKEYAFGIDLGGTTAKVGLFTTSGKLLEKWEVSTDTSNNGAHILENLAAAVQQKMQEKGLSADKVEGVGLGVPGPVLDSSIVPIVCANLGGWGNRNVSIELSELLGGIRVLVGNDANVAALGEIWMGCAKGCRSAVMVTLGTGVGGGILTGGRLLEGARGLGGELGHYRTHALDGVDCTCGAKGCWERYAATTALVRAAQEENPAWKDGRAIFAAAEAGNETVLALLDAWTDEIAQGLAGMVHIFNPQLILIGGGVSAQQKLLIEPIAEKVKASVMPAFAEGLEIRAAQLHNDAGMVGAVYYFRQTMEKE